MPTELTEEEMHRALFGGAQTSAPVEVHVQTVSDGIPNVAIVVPVGIPCALGHPVHEHLDSDSTLTWTLIPRPLGH